MSGLFVPLDVEYFTDEEFIDAGPLAELLYIRSLCFIKRKMLDGKIKRSQLVGFSAGIPNPQKQAERLVAVGLWRASGDGWIVPAYLKRNASKKDIEAGRAVAREAGIRGNHERWHIGEDGKPSPKCPLCREAIGVPDRGANRRRSPKPKTEPETKPEPQPEPIPETESSSSARSLRGDEPIDGVVRNLFKSIDEAAS